VLDCGCNLGELSRLARTRGAVLVDGIEYDKYFVQIAQLINAYRATTRVSFEQGNLTDASTIRGTYDVTLAFSVFPYILPVLPKVAETTREALVLETHNIASDLKSTYIEPVSRYFPHHTFVDYTDLGHGEGKRAVFVFAKERRALLPGGFLASTVDLSRSDFKFVDAMLDLTRQIGPTGGRDINSIRAVVNQADGIEDDSRKLTGGRTYWLMMMKGYLEYVSRGEVTLGNTYLMFLRSLMAKLKYDPVLADRLSSDEALIDRVKFRFGDVDLMAHSERVLAQIEPVFLSKLNDNTGRFAICHGETGNTFWANDLDGYHRIFWGLFFNFKKLPALYAV
jgi:SAM-dependent methyltransferase